MSELSTVAIKDGHRGHFAHHQQQPQEAERADRISRLAGLQGVVTARQSNLAPTAGGTGAAPPPGYFDGNNQPQIFRERSTVGSASATGSVGGRTTWASGSDVYDPDKMSEDQEVETSSTGGVSDEASLVGFGEGARTPARAHSGIGSPSVGKATPSAVPAYLRDQSATPMSGLSTGSSMATPRTDQQLQDARMIDGMTYDDGVVDTANRTPQHSGVDHSGSTGTETAERLMRDRMQSNTQGGDRMMDSPETRQDGSKALGKFAFENKQ